MNNTERRLDNSKDNNKSQIIKKKNRARVPLQSFPWWLNLLMTSIVEELFKGKVEIELIKHSTMMSLILRVTIAQIPPPHLTVSDIK